MSIGEEKRISREDFYKLHGLLALAREHNRALEMITRAAAQITGETERPGFDFGHTGDAVFQDYSVELLLAKLGIDVDG